MHARKPHSGPAIALPSWHRVRHLHAWARGRPILVAVPAQQLATFSLIAGQWVELIRNGRAAQTVYREAGIAEWLALYRSPRRLRDELKAQGLPLEGGGILAQIQAVLDQRKPHSQADALRSIDEAPEQMRKVAVEAVHAAFRQMYVEHCRDLAAMLDDEDVLPHLDMDRAMKTPEFQFFLLVMVPCLLEYGRSPMRLYASARRGNLESLDMLLRIDKSIIRDPVMGRVLQRIGMERPEFKPQMMAKAYEGVPKVKQELSNIKARLAAHIQNVAAVIGCELGPKDIRALFHALEKDVTGDPIAQDTDIDPDDDNWRQAIKRARSGDKRLKPFWHIDLKRDAIHLPQRHRVLLTGALVSDFDESEVYPDWLQRAGAGDGAASPPRPGPAFLQRIAASVGARWIARRAKQLSHFLRRR